MNQYDYGERIYDPRAGRFLSVDPLKDEFPFYSPYQYASNMPTKATDIDEMESSSNVNPTERPAWGQKGWINLAPYKLPAKKYEGNWLNRTGKLYITGSFLP